MTTNAIDQTQDARDTAQLILPWLRAEVIGLDGDCNPVIRHKGRVVSLVDEGESVRMVAWPGNDGGGA